MKTKFVSITLMLLLLLTGCGENTEETAEKTIEWPMYSISKDEKEVGVLLGSIHVGRQEWYPFPQQIREKLDDADVVISEVAFSQLYSNNVYTAERIAEATDGRTISEFINEEQAAELEEKLDSYDIQLDFTTATLMDLQIAQNRGYITQYFATNGVDYKVYEYLQKEKLLDKNIGLETVEQQLDMMNDSFANYIQSDNDWVAKFPTKEEIMSEMTAMLNAYETNEIQPIMDQGIAMGMDGDILLVQRNHAWLEELPKQLEENDNVFVVVGAGHLSGDDGLITLLENEGYQLALLSNDADES